MGNLTSTQFLNLGSRSPSFRRILEDGTQFNTCVASCFFKDGLWRQDLGRFICLSSNWGDFCRDAVAHAPRLLEWNSLQPCECTFLAKSNLHPQKVFGPPKHTIKHQTSTIMAGCSGSCTATILLVDWTISNYGFKILFWELKTNLYVTLR